MGRGCGTSWSEKLEINGRVSNNGAAGDLTLGSMKSVKPRGAALAIIDDVRSIIAQSLKLPVEKLTAETRLEELGAESLDVIEIVFALEEKYDIAIPLRADEATRLAKPDDGGQAKSEQSGGQDLPFSTVGDVAEIVEKLVAAKASK
jgi:acyl carrier protein